MNEATLRTLRAMGRDVPAPAAPDGMSPAAARTLQAMRGATPEPAEKPYTGLADLAGFTTPEESIASFSPQTVERINEYGPAAVAGLAGLLLPGSGVAGAATGLALGALGRGASSYFQNSADASGLGGDHLRGNEMRLALDEANPFNHPGAALLEGGLPFVGKAVGKGLAANPLSDLPDYAEATSLDAALPKLDELVTFSEGAANPAAKLEGMKGLRADWSAAAPYLLKRESDAARIAGDRTMAYGEIERFLDTNGKKIIGQTFKGLSPEERVLVRSLMKGEVSPVEVSSKVVKAAEDLKSQFYDPLGRVAERSGMRTQVKEARALPVGGPFSDEPAQIAEKDWFHGTGAADLQPSQLDPMMTKVDNLFGHGVYLTDNPNIAKGYATARGSRTGTPTIYKARLGDTNLLNLEQPASPALREIISRRVASGGDSLKGLFEEEIAALPENATGSDLWNALTRAIRYESKVNEIPAYEYTNVVAGISDDLRAQGYHGLTHVGGKLTGKDPHQVSILFDPNDTAGLGDKVDVRDWSQFDEGPKVGDWVPFKMRAGYAGPDIPLKTRESAAQLLRSRVFKRGQVAYQKLEDPNKLPLMTDAQDIALAYLDNMKSKIAAAHAFGSPTKGGKYGEIGEQLLAQLSKEDDPLATEMFNRVLGRVYTGITPTATDTLLGKLSEIAARVQLGKAALRSIPQIATNIRQNGVSRTIEGLTRYATDPSFRHMLEVNGGKSPAVAEYAAQLGVGRRTIPARMQTGIERFNRGIANSGSVPLIEDLSTAAQRGPLNTAQQRMAAELRLSEEELRGGVTADMIRRGTQRSADDNQLQANAIGMVGDRAHDQPYKFVTQYQPFQWAQWRNLQDRVIAPMWHPIDRPADFLMGLRRAAVGVPTAAALSAPVTALYALMANRDSLDPKQVIGDFLETTAGTPGSMASNAIQGRKLNSVLGGAPSLGLAREQMDSLDRIVDLQDGWLPVPGEDPARGSKELLIDLIAALDPSGAAAVLRAPLRARAAGK